MARWYGQPHVVYAGIMSPWCRGVRVPAELAAWVSPCWNLAYRDGPIRYADKEIKLTDRQKECIAILDVAPMYEYIPGVGVRTKQIYKVELQTKRNRDAQRIFREYKAERANRSK